MDSYIAPTNSRLMAKSPAQVALDIGVLGSYTSPFHPQCRLGAAMCFA